MREIKIRALFKNGERKEVALNNIYKGNKCYLYLKPQPFSDYEPVEIEEWIGIYDKYSNRVYEGDTVSIKNKFSVSECYMLGKVFKEGACFMCKVERVIGDSLFENIIGKVIHFPTDEDLIEIIEERLV